MTTSAAGTVAVRFNLYGSRDLPLAVTAGRVARALGVPRPPAASRLAAREAASRPAAGPGAGEPLDPRVRRHGPDAGPARHGRHHGARLARITGRPAPDGKAVPTRQGRSAARPLPGA